jgi:hypothetical protein
MMDVSPEYVKMCEKAEEIQKHKREFTYEDYVFCAYCKKVHLSLHTDKDVVWLPRQDQLQEMVMDTKYGVALLRNFYDWAVDGGFLRHERKWHLWSMEQLWLAFVMKELWNKHWNGEDWVIG